MKPTEQSLQRAPDGVETRKPVAMRMLPDEREELIALAGREQRSIGSMARLVYLRGLEALKREATA